VPNVHLLQQTLSYIETHPEEWQQGEWRCGTNACFAGHAALLAGARWVHPDHQFDDYVITPDAQEVFVADFAQQVLELNGDQASVLFDADNSMANLRHIVNQLCGKPAH
jgi:hypothetical protein